MNNQRAIKIIVYMTVLAWTAVLFIEHQTISSALLKPLSIVTDVVLWGTLAFDLWLWKLRIFRKWLIKRPLLEGSWRVVFHSDWIDPETGNPIGPREGFMVVRQTLTTLSMRQFTKESGSVLIGTELVCQPDGAYCLSGVYRNDPNYSVRHRSPIHYGALWLQIAEGPTMSLAGHYWTDRKTAGTLEMSDHYRQTFSSFDDASARMPPQALPRR